MYTRIVLNDISKSRLTTFITTLFITVATALVSLAVILMINLAGSIDTLTTQTKAMHFLQMHAGEIDRERLEEFANGDDRVADFQVLEFLNLDSGQFVIGDNSLASSAQDNGVSVQSERFDYMVDLDGNVIQPKDGDLYVPLSYFKDGTASVGDQATIAGQQFTVRGVLRDSQMNSTLSSSKRFLISENDYKQIQQSTGIVEYLIEFLLHDLAQLNAFETTYNNANLPSNGPTITYPLLRMINAISDGLVIAVLLLVSLLVVAVALLCVRLTLLAKIEDDYREIGVMKAIGLRPADIKKIYLAKYVGVVIIGALAGFGLSLLFQESLVENIRLYMGEGDPEGRAPWFGVLGIVLLCFIIVGYVYWSLDRLKKISPVQAIRQGVAPDKPAGARWLNLSRVTLGHVNVFMGVKEVIARLKLHITMMVIFIVAVFIMVLPYNLYATISDRSFVNHMGVGTSDILINIQQVDDIATKADEIAQHAANDSAIESYEVTITKALSVKLDDGSESLIKVGLGDHDTFSPYYSDGHEPRTSTDMALSLLLANEFEKKTGDTIALLVDSQEREMTISGIYSDITNGGKSAKATLEADNADTVWSGIYLDVKDSAQVDDTVAEYSRLFPFAKILDLENYMIQTFGSTIQAIQSAAIASMGVAIVLVFLITVLSVRMFVAKDRQSVAVLKAAGFTSRDIITQYAVRAVVVMIVALLAGAALVYTGGEALVGMFLSQIGASSVQLSVEPLFAYVFVPIVMLAIVIAATITGASAVKNINIAENIKE